MAQARRERSTAGGPAGWVVLLGLMVLALVIAATSKGCGDSEPTSPAAISPTTTATDTTAAGAAQVIDQINAEIQRTGVSFVTGKTELTASSKTTLDAVAAILAQSPTVKAEVQGYTDNQGDQDKNLALSQQRAEAVVAYLVGKGIAAARLTAKGFGEADPIGDNATEAGRAQNRRVQFAAGG